MLAHDKGNDEVERMDRDSCLNSAENDELGLVGADETWAVVWAETAAFSQSQRAVASHAARCSGVAEGVERHAVGFHSLTHVGRRLG